MSYVNNIYRWILYLIALFFLMMFAGCTDARNLTTTTEDITTTEEMTTSEPETCQFNIDIEVSGVIEEVTYDTIEPTYFMCVASGTNLNNQFTADGLCLNGFDMVDRFCGEHPLPFKRNLFQSGLRLAAFDDEAPPGQKFNQEFGCGG